MFSRAILATALLLAGTAAAAQQAPPTNSEAAFTSGLREMFRQTERHIAEANATPELMGLGPYPARMEVDLAFPDATIYRPANLAALGARKLGVVIWGNGGCANDGAEARAHLAEIASHAYLVVAPGKPLTGPLPVPGAAKSAPMTVKISDMRAALDWALAEGGRSGSPYFGRIDPTLVATAGHSCGGMLAILLAQDPRVRTVLIHNSGIFPVLPDNPPVTMHEERLQGIHGPVLLMLGGAGDVAQDVGERAFERLTKVPVFMGTLQVGHGGTFKQPHGGPVAKVAVDWLAWRLRGDVQASRTFAGVDCRLCRDASWTVRKKSIP